MTIDPHKMLLVDDDPNDIELVQLAIEDFDLIRTLDILTDGAQALEHLIGSESNPPVALLPQFVLMDLKLPKLTGLEVLKAIRQNPRTRTLPIVIMTSSSEDSDLRDCYDSGVNSYVVKPLDFYQFQDFVKLVVSYWMTINSPFSVLTS
jgi:two-component system response regulator